VRDRVGRLMTASIKVMKLAAQANYYSQHIAALNRWKENFTMKNVVFFGAR